jgi:hypothetical protein
MNEKEAGRRASLPLHILTFQFDDYLKKRARELYLDKQLTNSHRGIDARIIGAIGEAAFEEASKITRVHITRVAGESTAADYKLPSGALIEVKTKERSVRPRSGFEASRPQYNEDHQAVDFYVFVSIWNPTKVRNAFVEVAVLGAISRMDFEKYSYEVPKGTILGSGRGAWTAMRNVRIEQLNGLSILRERA